MHVPAFVRAALAASAHNFQDRGFFETSEASKVTWCLGVCYSMQRSKWATAEKFLKDSLRMKLKRAGRAALEVATNASRITLRVAWQQLFEFNCGFHR